MLILQRNILTKSANNIIKMTNATCAYCSVKEFFENRTPIQPNQPPGLYFASLNRPVE